MFTCSAGRQLGRQVLLQDTTINQQGARVFGHLRGGKTKRAQGRDCVACRLPHRRQTCTGMAMMGGMVVAFCIHSGDVW